MPIWKRWIIVPAALVLGVLVGFQANSSPTDNPPPDLIASQVMWTGWASGSEAQRAELYNAGPAEVIMRAVSIIGWESLEEGPREVRIPPGTRARSTLTARPSCDIPLPQELDVDVRTPSGTTSTTVALPPHSAALADVERMCARDFAPQALVVYVYGDWLSHESRNPQTALRVQTSLFADEKLVSAEVTAAGLGGNATGLPVDFAARTARFSVAWQVTSCSEATQLEDVTIELALRVGDGVRYETHSVPADVLFALSQYAAEECGL